MNLLLFVIFDTIWLDGPLACKNLSQSIYYIKSMFDNNEKNTFLKKKLFTKRILSHYMKQILQKNGAFYISSQ